MEYRTLGQTGLRVSVLGIGGWQLSGPLTIDGLPDGFPDIGRERATSMIKSCGELGINLIDTAEIYGDGEGERRVGKAIKGQRDRWIVSSKFGLRRGSKGERVIDCHPDRIRPSLERSLRHLNTDYIDIYLYHSPPKYEWIEPGKEVLEKLKQEGKIRFCGISTDDANILKLLAARDAVDVVSCAQSLLKQPQKILDLVQENNLGMITRGALAAGKLSGKYFHQSPNISSDDFRYQRKFNWSRYKSYEKLIPEGATMVGMSLRYLLDLDHTQTILIGGKSLQHYQEAVAALEIQSLESQVCQEIDRARAWQDRILRAKSLVRPLKKMIKA